MISTNPNLPPTASSDSVVGMRPAGPAMIRHFEDPEPGSCGWHLQRVVEQIESAEVKQVLRVLFGDLHRLLECLVLIEVHLRQVDAADETFALFQLIHDDARQLVEFIRTDAMNCADIGDDLAETLDGVTFVINHDLQRVFDGTSRGPQSDRTAHVILSRMHRAHDVLTNCLQQSTISLAMVFDDSLVGAKLFDNSDMRYRQSLQLLQDLLTLRQVVEHFEAQVGEKALVELIAGISKFRSESMERLMYSDWPQFESFCERITVSSRDLAALVPVLHQFQCYLETLSSQVRMRAVLANQASGSIPANEEASPVAPFAVAV